jgi:tetratricopeptide (TPR) repeat protein
MSSKTPIIRQISWPLVIPQLVVLGILSALSMLIWGEKYGSSAIAIGAMIYLSYSYGIRLIVLSRHRAGIILTKQRQFAEAITQFKQSYAFLSRYSWIDRLRAITLMSPSAISFREMALVNIAFCYSQMGNKAQTKASYERALKEFPNSAMARTALNLISTIENPTQN